MHIQEISTHPNHNLVNLSVVKWPAAYFRNTEILLYLRILHEETNL